MRKLMLAMIVVVLSAAVANGQRELTYEQVKQVASEAVTQELFKYEIPDIRFDQNKGTVWWAWGNFLLPYKRPIDYVVMVQAQIEVFRLGYGVTITADWDSMARNTEKLIANDMLPVVYDPALDDQQKLSRLKALHANESAKYENALKNWADKNGWRYQRANPPASAYRLTIFSNPRKAQIKVAHIVRYRVALLEGKDPATLMDVIPDGSRFIWTGQHVVAAKFPNGEEFPAQALRIESDGILTITPTAALFQER